MGIFQPLFARYVAGKHGSSTQILHIHIFISFARSVVNGQIPNFSLTHSFRFISDKVLPNTY